MSSPPAPSVAAALLSELADVVQLSSVCIPAAARRLDPQLERSADDLRLTVTARPAGDEDLLCVAAAAQPSETLAELETTLQRFEQDPFLLMISTASPAGSASATAAAMLRPPSRWLARVDGPADEAVLIAPQERLLSAPELPGEWNAAPLLSEQLASAADALQALWQSVERDRRSLAGVIDRLEAHARQLDEARGARDRLSAEVERLRAAERREADRLRLEALEDRVWVAEQVTRLADSTSWRLGHRLVRMARRLALRGDRGTNLPARIIERMREPR